MSNGIAAGGDPIITPDGKQFGFTAGTSVNRGGRTVRLKWHKLRQQPDDPPFLRRNLAAGLAVGASLEVDIRALADGRFVCLHDPVLERETTGRGPVAQADSAAVSGLRMLEGGEPLLFLDDLTRDMREGSVNPAARIQLDLCGAVDEKAVRAFTAVLDGLGARFILSAYDWEAVRYLGRGIAGLALGYDPTEEARTAGADVFDIVRATAPEAQWIYLHRALVRRSWERGDGLVDHLHAAGHQVDSWTLDQGTPGAFDEFRVALEVGCDQITTNTAALWTEAIGVGS